MNYYVLPLVLSCIVSLIALVATAIPGNSQQAKTETLRPLEPPAFWTDICNDEKLPTWRRGVAIYFLCERHLKKGMTLEELARVLGKPTWFKSVSGFDGNGPSLAPIEWSRGDTMFQIVIFQNENPEIAKKEQIGLYISFFGRVNYEAFFWAVLKQEKSKYDNSKVKAWALSPPWEEYVKSLPR